MENIPNCPKCGSEYTYQDGDLYICPECAYEWNPNEEEEAEQGLVVKDANGNILQDGDTVTVIKDLKVKGSSSGIKVGTKIKGIRLVESNDGHNIDCKVPGVGAIKLKQEFVKKAQIYRVQLYMDCRKESIYDQKMGQIVFYISVQYSRF